MLDEKNDLEKPQDIQAIVQNVMEGTDELADKELEQISGGADSFAQESSTQNSVLKIRHDTAKSSISNVGP